MKKIVFYCALANLFLLNLSVPAQVSLPYYSGFDNAAEQNGWTEYKTASTQFSNWNYASFGAYSPPNLVGHDYSPSTGITLTDNWFVSPGFLIPNGGNLDSIRYMFSGFSVPVAGDTIGIYLLNGSQDPVLATTKILLHDFRGTDYITDNVFRVKTNIYLPALSGTSYFAIRYRNTDCSSKWLTVNFDNIAISEGNVGINETEKNSAEITVYPNPSTGKIILADSDEIQSVTIQDEKGQIVFQSSFSKNDDNSEIDLSDKPKGIYLVTVERNGKTIVQKLVLQ